MAVPKKDTFRLVSSYQAVNAQVEQSFAVMPIREDMRELPGAQLLRQVGPATGKLATTSRAGGLRDLYDCYARSLFHADSCPAGRIECHGVPQGMPIGNLRDLNGKAWVDDSFFLLRLKKHC